MERRKVFVLDTNVLIHDPHAIWGFAEAIVIIPMIVLEELDRFKSDNSDRGRSVREVIRSLDALRARGSLGEGILLDNGSLLRVIMADANRSCSTAVLPDMPDNQIISLAICLREDGFAVTVLSKDLNMRVKADVLGIDARDYVKDEISAERLYKGWITFQVPAVQLKKGVPSDLLELSKEYPFSPNEYVIVQANHNEHHWKLFRHTGHHTFKAIEAPTSRWGIQPRNVQQLIALDLLLDDSIQLVTLLGPAGTGKTFLTLVAALQKMLIEHIYTKILISRPVVPLGPDIGYLPGTLGEKLHTWMQPMYDNMEFIIHAASAAEQHIAFDEEQVEQKEGRDRYRKDGKKGPRKTPFPTLDELVMRGKISLEAITYMRGRSIPYQFIFIDEVQNLTPHEVKTIISRVGEGSKIVLSGDPQQIDSPYLNFLSNGLVVASQKFKGQQLFGTAFLEISERSELSKLAGSLL